MRNEHYCFLINDLYFAQSIFIEIRFEYHCYMDKIDKNINQMLLFIFEITFQNITLFLGFHFFSVCFLTFYLAYSYCCLIRAKWAFSSVLSIFICSYTSWIDTLYRNPIDITSSMPIIMSRLFSYTLYPFIPYGHTPIKILYIKRIVY